jgi:4-amino-4-deoxy-L-arabinose transferase-like glycosyltransferase
MRAHNLQSTISNQQWIAIAALLVAALFRALPLTDNGFHPDEALYAYFARLIASGRNPLLAEVVVDKPPLPFYLNALSLLALGPTPLAARLPTFFAGIVSVALLYRLARRVYEPRLAALAAWLFALSPFAILFAVTLFLDPLLTAFVLWGWWMAAAQRTRGAAVAFALAFAVKQTALFFVPLGLALALTRLPPGAPWREAARELWRMLQPIVAGGAIVFALTLAWDAARRPPIGVWSQGYADNAPNRLIRSSEVLPRATAWRELLGYVTASPVLNAAFVLGLPLLIVGGLRHPSRLVLVDVLSTFYFLLYLAAYWLLAFNVWDRYLVPLVPLVMLLLARVVWRLTDSVQSALNFQPSAFRLLPIAFCLLLLPSALTASRSGYPIGGDHGAYDGIEDVARFVNRLPSGAVLYDFWLSWQWNFHLFDGPAYVAWMPSPEAFESDLRSFGRSSPRYLVVPAWEAEVEARAAAARAGFSFQLVHTGLRRDGAESFRVYRLAPGP